MEAAGASAEARDAGLARRAIIAGAVVALAELGLLAAGPSPAAHADEVAYLVNVTVRPGYNFANADHALTYGRALCAKMSAGVPFAQMVRDIKSDFRTSDDYQGTYLLSQAAQELCPVNIWQLRNSAAGYRPPA
jgi:Protein of unknown function (DUF732)